MDDDVPQAGFIRRWLRRPKDAVSLCLVGVATGVIVVNALFLQAGPHPAPIFAEVTPPPTANTTATVPTPPPAKRNASTRLPAATLPATPVKASAAPVRSPDVRLDPIAELLEPSNRTMAVQRALAEFGYGQIKPTGTIGPETKAAIEKFERERKLPVTGQVSERLTRELSAMKGSPL
jgi:hypothetical protein